MEDFCHLEIPLEDVMEATNNFTNKPIGSGGFGPVYKGELLLPTGPKTVAIKRLDRKSMQGDVEFWKEIMMLSDLEHKNLAPLLHFCKEGDERILVYEYASGGSLDTHLHDPSLTYVERIVISVGAAKGIEYLHDPKINTQQQRVLHRDIKSSNILLDDKMTPKVSDLGLSKYGPANQARSYVVSNVVGTPGYVDPVYMETGILSKESDVYSFGVVLLELICGKLCYKYDKEGGLVDAWKKCCDEDKLDDIIFPDLMKQQLDQESLWTYVTIAKRCLNRNRKDRPTMTEVVKELEFALHLQQNSEHDKFNPTKMPTSYRFMEEFRHLRIGLRDIQLATNNFSNDNIAYCELDGSWIHPLEFGHGQLYKGEFSQPWGKVNVFFKRFHRGFKTENEVFWELASALSNEDIFQSRARISLWKFCCEGDEMILVYYFQPFYCDDQYLRNSNLIWWTQHLQQAVADLECTFPNNIANNKHSPPSQPHTCSTSQLDLSEKHDVHAFGVGLFDRLRDILPSEYCDGDPSSFVRKWKRCYDTKRLEEIMFPNLNEQIDKSSLNTFVSIACRCVSEDPKKRPMPGEIFKELEKALQLQMDFEEKQRNENLEISNRVQYRKLQVHFEEKLKNNNPKNSSILQYQSSWPFLKGVHARDGITC